MGADCMGRRGRGRRATAGLSALLSLSEATAERGTSFGRVCLGDVYAVPAAKGEEQSGAGKSTLADASEVIMSVRRWFWVVLGGFGW